MNITKGGNGIYSVYRKGLLFKMNPPGGDFVNSSRSDLFTSFLGQSLETIE